MTKKQKRWTSGNRAFYWTPEYEHKLCLQSKQHNFGDCKLTWVYYSKADAKKLYKFLKKIFE